MLNPAVLQNQEFRLAGELKTGFPIFFWSYCVDAREVEQWTKCLLCKDGLSMGPQYPVTVVCNPTTGEVRAGFWGLADQPVYPKWQAPCSVRYRSQNVMWVCER